MAATLAPLGTASDPEQQQQQQKNKLATADSSYEVADTAFLSIIDRSAPVRLVAERDYDFAHEAPVHLEKLNKASRLRGVHWQEFARTTTNLHAESL